MSRNRRDGKGTTFGRVHRLPFLATHTCMTDMDRLVMDKTGVMNTENKTCVEYRHRGDEFVFFGIIELKNQFDAEFLDLNSSSSSKTSSVRALLELARRNDMKFIMCFATNGAMPLYFYEIDHTTKKSITGNDPICIAKTGHAMKDVWSKLGFPLS